MLGSLVSNVWNIIWCSDNLENHWSKIYFKRYNWS